MEDHLFYVLEQYKNAGTQGIPYYTTGQEIIKTPEFLHLYGKRIEVDSNQINVISEKGIEAYHFEKSIRDEKNIELEKEKLIKQQT